LIKKKQKLDISSGEIKNNLSSETNNLKVSGGEEY
jgi:hypothetical protein